jgi:hypothetical protein
MSTPENVQITPAPTAAPMLPRRSSPPIVGATVCPANPVATATRDPSSSGTSVRPAPCVPVVVSLTSAATRPVDVVLNRPTSTIFGRTAVVAYSDTSGRVEVPAIVARPLMLNRDI